MNPTLKIFVTVGIAIVALAALAASQIGFKYASGAQNFKITILWFLAAGVAGTISMVLYTILLRFVPLSIGYAVLFGLGFVLVQVVAAKLILKEQISVIQWFGGAVMVAGILMIAFGGQKG
jgi:multidrug transporter EmrE-like cation transporter